MPIEDRREELRQGKKPKNFGYGPVSEERQNQIKAAYEQKKGNYIVEGAQQGIAPEDLGRYTLDRNYNPDHMGAYRQGQPRPTPSPAIEAPRGQDPQGYGFSNSYQPSPQAQAFAQVLEALQDPRMAAFAPGMSLIRAPGFARQAMGQAGHAFQNERGNIPNPFHRPNIDGPRTPQDPGGFNVPTRTMEQQAPIRESFAGEGINNPTTPQLRGNYLDGIEGMHQLNSARQGLFGPAAKLQVERVYNSMPQAQPLMNRVFDENHALRSDVLNRQSQFFNNQDYPTGHGDLRRPTYPEHN